MTPTAWLQTKEDASFLIENEPCDDETVKQNLRLEQTIYGQPIHYLTLVRQNNQTVDLNKKAHHKKI